jgi:hypothetical protein
MRLFLHRWLKTGISVIKCYKALQGVKKAARKVLRVVWGERMG